MMQSREDYYPQEENPEAQLKICVYWPEHVEFSLTEVDLEIQKSLPEFY